MPRAVGATTLQLFPASRRAIEERAPLTSKLQRNLSAPANTVLTRYDALMRAGLAEANAALTPEDWGMLRAILNGSLYDHPDAVHIEILADVHDAADAYGDTSDLRVRLSRLSPLALYAVADAVERWWGAARSGRDEGRG